MSTTTLIITPEQQAHRNIALMNKVIKDNKIGSFYVFAEESKKTPGLFVLIEQKNDMFSGITVQETTHNGRTSYEVATAVCSFHGDDTPIHLKRTITP